MPKLINAPAKKAQQDYERKKSREVQQELEWAQQGPRSTLNPKNSVNKTITTLMVASILLSMAPRTESKFVDSNENTKKKPKSGNDKQSTVGAIRQSKTCRIQQTEYKKGTFNKVQATCKSIKGTKGKKVSKMQFSQDESKIKRSQSDDLGELQSISSDNIVVESKIADKKDTFGTHKIKLDALRKEKFENAGIEKESTAIDKRIKLHQEISLLDAAKVLFFPAQWDPKLGIHVT